MREKPAKQFTVHQVVYIFFCCARKEESSSVSLCKVGLITAAYILHSRSQIALQSSILASWNSLPPFFAHCLASLSPLGNFQRFHFGSNKKQNFPGKLWLDISFPCIFSLQLKILDLTIDARVIRFQQNCTSSVESQQLIDSEKKDAFSAIASKRWSQLHNSP